MCCASPNENDRIETQNTLSYGNREKNIQNEISANKSKSSRLIADLQKTAELEMKNLKSKSVSITNIFFLKC